MQVVTIFFPMYEAYRSRIKMRTILSAIKTWEDKRAANSDSNYSSSQTGKGSSYDDSSQSSSPSSNNDSTRSKEIYAMASLEKALAVNPMPLLHFSATKDFTAENIIFLMRVKDWRQAWKQSPRLAFNPSQPTPEARTHLFRKGLETYMTCVHDSTAEFPINIEGSIRGKLDIVFEHALPLNEDKGRQSSGVSSDDFDAMFDFQQPSVEASFNHIALTAKNGGAVAAGKPGAWGATKQSGSTEVSLPRSSGADRRDEDDEGDEVKILDFGPGGWDVGATDVGAAGARVGEGFDVEVFDAAEASIKYLVLTNTW